MGRSTGIYAYKRRFLSEGSDEISEGEQTITGNAHFGNSSYSSGYGDDPELLAIMEREFGSKQKKEIVTAVIVNRQCRHQCPGKLL